MWFQIKIQESGTQRARRLRRIVFRIGGKKKVKRKSRICGIGFSFEKKTCREIQRGAVLVSLQDESENCLYSGGSIFRGTATAIDPFQILVMRCRQGGVVFKRKRRWLNATVGLSLTNKGGEDWNVLQVREKWQCIAFYSFTYSQPTELFEDVAGVFLFGRRLLAWMVSMCRKI